MKAIFFIDDNTDLIFKLHNRMNSVPKLLLHIEHPDFVSLDIEGAELTARLTDETFAVYEFSVVGDELVHESSRELGRQDWILIARRQP